MIISWNHQHCAETCSVTEGAKDDNQRWWSVQLKSNVNVREVAVTINHGVAFHQQFTVFIIGEKSRYCCSISYQVSFFLPLQITYYTHFSVVETVYLILESLTFFPTTARSGDLRTKFVKCKSFDGLFRAGMRHVLKCPDGGITGEKVRNKILYLILIRFAKKKL